MNCFLYIDVKRAEEPETREAMQRAEHNWGAKKVRYELFEYRPAVCASDEFRDNNRHLDLHTPAGTFRGIRDIRQFFPLPKVA
jgi:hypothetical protein